MTDIPADAIGIEVRSIYDGVSIWRMPDGSLVNRWPAEDRRHAATQEWIERVERE